MKRIFIYAFAITLLVLLFAPGCGSTGGTENPGGGGGGTPHLADGSWRGETWCMNHPNPFYPDAFHKFVEVKFDVLNGKIVKASSSITYHHPDGYIQTKTAVISGEFWPGAIKLRHFDISEFPGYVRHRLTRLVSNSQDPLQTEGGATPTRMYGVLVGVEYGDDFPLGDAAVDYYLDVTKQ